MAHLSGSARTRGGAKAFTHREGGTDEPSWLLDPRWDGVPRLGLADLLRRYPRVLLIAPHPDDETLALGATIADLAGNGTSVTVAVVTHGGPGSVRRGEGEQAIRALSPRISTVWWDLPDGELERSEDELRARVGALVDDSTLILAPVECDGHSDHEAVSRAAQDVALGCSAALLLYPVWLWHWASPDDVDWSRLRTLAPPLSALTAKRAAIEWHRSQLVSGDGYPIVGASVLARAQRVIETVLVPQPDRLAVRVEDAVSADRGSAEVARPFDTMYSGGNDDPWLFDESEYERRRIGLLLACLGRQRYGSVLEIGCASGQLACRLADVADAVVGVDASAAALRVARANRNDVRWVRGVVPRDVPDGEFDVVVLSEVGYFLDGVDLLATLRAMRRRVRRGGELVVANWRGPTEDVPLNGPTVQQQAVAMLDLPVRAHYEDADLVIDVWGQPISVLGESGEHA